MGRHSIRGIRSGNELNVAGKDDPRKTKKHRKIEFQEPAHPPAFPYPPVQQQVILPTPPPVYEGWMDHWDPMADLERVLEQDRQRRKRQTGY